MTLWHPPETIPRPKVKAAKIPPANGFDATICKPCANRGACLHICAPLSWIDGNKPRKETFINANMDHYQSADYKESLAELSAHYDPPGMIDEIRAIKNLKARAIALLLYGWIGKEETATLLHIPRRSFYRTLKRAK